MDGSGNLVNTAGGFKSGAGSGNSGYDLYNGATSGGAGWAVPAVAGSSILYLLPSTAGTTGQFLQDTGSVTCPTLASGAPGTCHQMLWTFGALTLISQQVLGSPTASVTFSSIVSTYTNLQITIYGQTTATTAQSVVAQFNGDTATNYDCVLNIAGPTTTVGGFGAYATATPFVGNLASNTTAVSYPGVVSMIIYSYSSTSFFKMATDVSAQPNSSSSNSFANNGMMTWKNTAAINAVKLFPNSGSFATGTVITLYGMQ